MNYNEKHKCIESIHETMYVDEATIMGSSYAPFLIGCGENSRAFFVRVYEKSCPFSQQPVKLETMSRDHDWNMDEITFRVPKSIDYLNGLYFKFILKPKSQNIDFRKYFQTMNCGHQIIKECRLLFNDMVADKFNNHVLNLTQTFSIPNCQKNNYHNMISGYSTNDVDIINNSQTYLSQSNYLSSINNSLINSQFNDNFVNSTREIIQPVPFWFCQQDNTQSALPVASVPYNDIKVSLDINEISKVFTGQLSNQLLTSIDVELWGNAIVVSNKERASMSCTPKDVLMRQYDSQTLYTTVNDCLNSTQNIPTIKRTLRFNGALEALYFGCHGNCDDLSPSYTDENGLLCHIQDESIYCDVSGTSLIRKADIIYEESESRTGSQSYWYYQNVQPFYHASNSGYGGPRDEGKLLYSFALDVNSHQHSGFVDFSKLSLARINLWIASQTGLSENGGINLTTSSQDASDFPPNHPIPSNASVEVVGRMLNIGRFTGGAFGMPIV